METSFEVEADNADDACAQAENLFIEALGSSTFWVHEHEAELA